MDRVPHYAVIGAPIEHSLSPLIHAAYARQTGITLQYDRMLVPQSKFEDAVNQFFVSGGAGLNVTAPLKELAFDYADMISNKAMNAGAVNTLQYFDGDLVYGDNTDGVGLVTDLEHHLKRPLQGTRLLVLGAGGATRGCLESLLQTAPDALYLHNRTVSKARHLIRRFSHIGEISLLPSQYRKSLTFDVVVNATSASVTGGRPDFDHRYLHNALAYDMMYGQNAQSFLKWALAHGALAAHDGLGMLIEQAAESFRIWHGLRPQTQEIRATLQRQLQLTARSTSR
ncbi:MAG: shikimate dehydrogenase [Gammaproteobacteria bacterium]|nr:shikimate dehydrogenase [Gammaproteobacteria bacterium]